MYVSDADNANSFRVVDDFGFDMLLIFQQDQKLYNVNVSKPCRHSTSTMQTDTSIK